VEHGYVIAFGAVAWGHDWRWKKGMVLPIRYFYESAADWDMNAVSTTYAPVSDSNYTK
jgi:hypothetical protein